MSGPPELDLYDIAYLAGGADRVVDTALVALVESGRIRVHAPGELAVEEQIRRSPVDAAVMDAVGTHGHRSIDTVRWRLADDARLAELGRALAAAGLLKRRAGLGRRGRPAEWTTTTSGRDALRRVTERPPTAPALDGGSALQVALHGRETMPDAALRSSIFEHPLPTVERGADAEDTRRRRRDAADGNPSLAAYRTGGPAQLGGGSVLGMGGDVGGSGF
jgi:hypothetical protein